MEEEAREGNKHADGPDSKHDFLPSLDHMVLVSFHGNPYRPLPVLQVSWAEPLPTRGEAAITEQIGNSSVLKREGIYLVLNQTRPTEACGTEP